MTLQALGRPGDRRAYPRVTCTLSCAVAGLGEGRVLNVSDGGAFIARKDDPGACPGDGWQMIVQRGKPGAPGEKGAKGDRGEPGPAGPGVLHLQVDDAGLFTLVNGDGSAVTTDFYPLLSRLGG